MQKRNKRQFKAFIASQWRSKQARYLVSQQSRVDKLVKVYQGVK